MNTAFRHIKVSAISVLMIVLGNINTSAQNDYTSRVIQYITTYKDLAIKEQKRTSIPAAITLAQGIHETSAGQSELAINANNHFGIKCKKTWTGETFTFTDDAPNECFRKYATAENSYRDHSDYLKTTPRYSRLFELPVTDYASWALGLKKAGYSISPSYAQVLIKLIEDFRLQEYTYAALDGTSPFVNAQKMSVTNQSPTIISLEKPKSAIKLKKYAFVVGCNNYKFAKKLKNCRNDATDMAALFKTFDFEVSVVLDAQRGEILKEWNTFLQKTKNADVAVVFFSGHGIDLDNSNFLVPVDYDFDYLQTSSVLLQNCLSVDILVEELKKNEIQKSILLLDACRVNPYKGMKGGDLTGGLSRPNSYPGVFIVYAASPGYAASENENGRNSYLTEGLLTSLIDCNRNIYEVCESAFSHVSIRTNNKQIPCYFGTTPDTKFRFCDTVFSISQPRRTLLDTAVVASVLKNIQFSYIDSDNDQVPDSIDKEPNTPYSCRPVDRNGVGNCLKALANYKQLQYSSTGSIAAEARYNISEIYLYQGKLREAEEAANNTIKLSSGNDYWVVKSYILIADILTLQKDYFNAKATLQSIAKNTKVADLKNEALTKLDNIKRIEQGKPKMSEE